MRCATEVEHPTEAQGKGSSPTDAALARHEQLTEALLAASSCAPPGATTSVVARWSGESVPQELSPVHGFRSLRFQFPDGEELEFRPQTAPLPGDWSCNLFSPGCRYVALLIGNSKGYHVVELENLRSYLKGQTPPLAVLHYSGELPKPHHYGHGHWVSLAEFEFFVSSTNPSHGDGWAETEGLWLRANASRALPGADLPLAVSRRRFKQPPDDGCAIADARP